MLPARFWAVRFKESFGVGNARSMDGSRVSKAKVEGKGRKREGRITRGEKGEESIDGRTAQRDEERFSNYERCPLSLSPVYSYSSSLSLLFLSRSNRTYVFLSSPSSHFLHIHPLVERDEQIFARIRDDRS